MTSPAPKKRGRPKKVFSEDPEMDKLLHEPHDTWDFTDYVLPFTARDEFYCDGADTERYDFWMRLDFKTLEGAHEICPDTGRPHIQGRIRFLRKYRFDALKKIMPSDVHFEPSKACKDDNYLRKHDSKTVFKIDNRCQGQRNIFKEQTVAIAAGSTIRECAEMEGANYQSVRSAELLMKYIEPERPTAPREVIYVETFDAVPAGVYRVPADHRFWDGYDAHSAIFIFQPLLNMSIHQLSQLTGPAPFRLPKGRQARFDTVYIYGASHDDRNLLYNP